MKTFWQILLASIAVVAYLYWSDACAQVDLGDGLARVHITEEAVTAVKTAKEGVYLVTVTVQPRRGDGPLTYLWASGAVDATAFIAEPVPEEIAFLSAFCELNPGLVEKCKKKEDIANVPTNVPWRIPAFTVVVGKSGRELGLAIDSITNREVPIEQEPTEPQGRARERDRDEQRASVARRPAPPPFQYAPQQRQLR